jgi:PhnB protein
MHTSLTLPNGQIIMASDTIDSIPECRSQELVAGNNFTISITPDNEAEADKLFAALAAGGTISMPLQKTFWNAYFGMLTDKFGIQWMVNYDYPQN